MPDPQSPSGPPPKPRCPDCGRVLQRVRRPSGSMLNDDQFDAVRAGDWFCASCPSNGRSNTSNRYFWDRELAARQPGPPPEPRTALAWLIESGANPPTYWDGRNLGAGGFTPKHEEACRFARFQDAEMVRCWLIPEGLHFCKSVQHEWVDDAALRAVSPPAPPEGCSCKLTPHAAYCALVLNRAPPTPAPAPEETLAQQAQRNSAAMAGPYALTREERDALSPVSPEADIIAEQEVRADGAKD